LVDFHFSKGRTIIMLSGRDSVCMNDTRDWLNLHSIYHDYLFMRPKDDMRKDTIVKQEIYKQQILNRFNVLCVFDDRLQVLNMWYNEGIFTFNVNQGNLEF